MGKFKEQISQYAHTDYADILQQMGEKADEREASALPVGVVTNVIVAALEAERPRTRYPVPRKRLTGWWLPRLLPDRWFDRLVARTLGIGNR